MKKISDNQRIGEQGEALAKARVLRIGFVYHHLGRLEAGVDGMIELRDPQTGAMSGRMLGAQVKTRAKGRYSRETGEGFEYLLDADDVAYWAKSNIPMIIVLCRLEDDSFYWKPIRDHVAGEPRRLLFDKARDTLNEAAASVLANLLVDRAEPGHWVPPLAGGEDVLLNVLPITLPEETFISEAAFGTGRRAAAELANLGDPRHDWVQRGRRVLSFHDPHGKTTEAIVEPGSVEAVGTALIAQSDDPDAAADMADLLRRTLERQFEDQLMFAAVRGRRLFAFRPQGVGRPLTYHYRSARNAAHADVVMVERRRDDPDRIAFVRHHAFEPRFERLGDTWCMAVTPTYYFTRDGYRPLERARAQTLLAGKKRLDKNSALWGQMHMWQYLFCGEGGGEGSASLFDTPAIPEPWHLMFDRAPIVTLPAATPEAAWKRGRDETDSGSGEGEVVEDAEGDTPSDGRQGTLL